jgi:hypothetical protein
MERTGWANLQEREERIYGAAAFRVEDDRPDGSVSSCRSIRTGDDTSPATVRSICDHASAKPCRNTACVCMPLRFGFLTNIDLSFVAHPRISSGFSRTSRNPGCNAADLTRDCQMAASSDPACRCTVAATARIRQKVPLLELAA